MGWIIYFTIAIIFYGIFLGGQEKRYDEITGSMYIAIVISALVWPFMLIAAIGYGISKQLGNNESTKHD